IYDHAPDRPRLIDFEVFHDKSLPAPVRHADDLLVFLLDLVGFVPKKRWLPMALAFLRAYGDADVIDELRKRLAPPRGIARIWWRVRTNCVDPHKIQRRL